MSKKQEETGNVRKKKKGTAIVIGLAILVAAAGGIFAGTQIKQEAVAIHTIGSETVSIEYGTDYKDEGAKAIVSGFMGQRSLPVTTTGRVDTEKTGTYKITYTTEHKGKKYTAERTVEVKDTQAPEIIITYRAPDQISWLTGQKQAVVTAHDDYDGDLTDKIKAYSDSKTIVYTVEDSSGNKTEATRNKEKTIAPPEIVFDGDNDVLYTYENEEIMLPGYSAVDGNGNNLTDYIEIEGDYDITRQGTYQLKYVLENDAGETVEKIQTVVVQRRMNPDIPYDQSKIIYLTFDGGPCAYTEELLNILGKYNVKASFFVTDANPAFENKLLPMKNAGHTIGVLGYSGNFSAMYESEEAFDEEFRKMESVIRINTGNDVHLMRFPGGSNNNYTTNMELMTDLIAHYTSLGYRYIDWTINSGDTDYLNTPDNIYINTVNNIMQGGSNIVLLHDSNRYTINAMESIILWGLKNGYTFMPII